LEEEISHDRVTRILSAWGYGSKELWGEVKATVRQIERDDGCLIFDDAIQEKAWTDENEIMCGTLITAKGVRSKASTCSTPYTVVGKDSFPPPLKWCANPTSSAI
jgi:hypothetical protein